MNTSRLRGWLCALLLCCGGAMAATLQAERDFRLLTTPLASVERQIEVTEFFWYGCSHCADFEPLLAAWAKTLPADVRLRRVPVALRDAWLPGARLYYTLEALGRLEALHGAVFAAIHKDRLRLNGESAMREWAITQGIAGDAFSAAWHGFGTEAKVLEAQRLARQAGIAGVPALVVDGRYLVLTGGTYGDLLHRAERLIAHAREERAVRPALAPPVTQELTQ